MKIALVTGASSGIGRDFVRGLDSYGFDEIWAIARREDRLLSLAEECVTKIRAFPLDLRDESSFDILSGMLREHSPEIVYLVCAAGFGRFGSWDEICAEDSCSMIELNCAALVRMTDIALAYMTSGAKIIEVASASAFQPLPYMNVYAATKAFVHSYSRALGCELKERGITVCALCPGWVKTYFIQNAEKTSKNAVESFPGMARSEEVVRKALRAADQGKSVCVPGVLYKAQRIASKLLPASALMSLWNLIRKS